MMALVEEQMLVLVDEQDNAVGTMEKMEVHQKALLHRAFSVFIFNSNGEMLLQRRALSKYHSGGLWTNACCSHPNTAETPVQAAQRRLFEELGFVTDVEVVFDFIYKAELDNELTEYEFDHVLVGNYDGKIDINLSEVGDYCYRSIDDIRNEFSKSNLEIKKEYLR
jgi:isopentenyl-diphosphate delta-isomerase